jgi:hypothetical protein
MLVNNIDIGVCFEFKLQLALSVAANVKGKLKLEL